MKYIFSFSFMFLLSVLYSQDQDLKKINCTKNDSLSEYKITCMDCYEGERLVGRKYYRVEIDSVLVDEKNRNYIELDSLEGLGVVGIYKNGKPYDGFFRNENAEDKEWLMFDFYEQGNLVYQVYNDWLEDMYKEDEKETRIINKKNIFKRGKLWEGIQIYPELISWKGAKITLLTNFKEGKEEKFTLFLAAMHYGEVVTISNLENGYYFDSWSRGKIKINYLPLENKIEFIDAEGKIYRTVEEEYVSFEEFDKEEELHRERLAYFAKSNKLFISRPVAESGKWNDYREKGFTTALLGLTENLPYKFTPLKIKDIIFFLNNKYWLKMETVGVISNFEGKLYGIDVEPGGRRGKYRAVYYDEGKVVSVKSDQTLKELADLFVQEIRGE